MHIHCGDFPRAGKSPRAVQSLLNTTEYVISKY